MTEVGFNINPYDPCVANKMTDGQHLTICYHVDGRKLSHRRSKVNDQMIKWLRQEHESISEDGSGKMTASKGKVHNYLGMTLGYTVGGQFQIMVINFLYKTLISFNKAEPKGGGTKTSAALENLFKVDEDCKNIPHNKTAQFHNLAEKNLYTAKRARPDTCTAVTFPTKRVQAPDLDDWAKIFHMMR